MLYFKRHPEYESIEAMIKERGYDDPYIRIIITRLDGTQVDHINDAEAVKALKLKKAKREMLYTPIYYQHVKENGKTHIVLKFISFKGERVHFDFYAPKPSDKYAHLIDPGTHSLHTSLPVMYPEKTTLAGPKSKIVINDIYYKIPVKICIPLFFKRMKGYYSYMFNMGVLRANVEHKKIIHVPQEILPGEKWIYDCGNRLEVYKIAAIEGNTMLLFKDGEEITADIDGNVYKIRMISLFSPLNDGKKAEFSIEFTPSLPISSDDGVRQTAESNFSISINSHKSLITGKAKSEMLVDSTRLLLAPSRPEWTSKRPVLTLISRQGGEFIQNTSILYDAGF